MKSKLLRLISNNFKATDLTQNKILVGRSENCDLVIEHDSISHYHAMIFQDQQGSLTILDLDSNNGTYINGNKLIQKTFFGEDDHLTFGKVHATVVDSLEVFELHNVEENTVTSTVDEKIYIPSKRKDNEVLIDDEYCDIHFNDEEFTPLDQSPLKSLFFDSQAYIASDDFEESFDIVEEHLGTCIQVTMLVSGSILEQYYLPLDAKHYSASGNSQKGHLLVDVIDNRTYDFINVEASKVILNPLDGFQYTETELDLNDRSKVLILTKGTYQIMIEINDVANHLIEIPRFIRNKSFYKEVSKIVTGIMLPMLLLLLVDFAPEKKKPLKTLSIVYKKPTNATKNENKLTSSNPSKENQNNGHKKTQQNEKKVANNKAGEKSQQKPAKMVAQTKPEPKTESKKSKAPVKAYQFKMASNINSMFSAGENVKIAQNRAPAAINSNMAVSGSLNTKVNGTASNTIGNMGSDLAGAEASYGAKGISSKKGFDSSYIQTKTVVLGSMDPELLRKILSRYLPQFRHCYQQELAYNREDIKGVVDLNFTIFGSGKVGDIDIVAKDKRFSKKGIDCMNNVLSIIEFPEPKGGGKVAVRQPLNFFSEQSKS